MIMEMLELLKLITSWITPDIINGSFEFVGACILWLNVIAIRRDKQLIGYNAKTTMFFSAWGAWNLLYYPSLDQWFSFVGGIAIFAVNSIWLFYVYYYKAHPELANDGLVVQHSGQKHISLYKTDPYDVEAPRKLIAFIVKTDNGNWKLTILSDHAVVSDDVEELISYMRLLVKGDTQ